MIKEEELTRILHYLSLCKEKLNNPKFIEKAPKEIVDKEKSKLADIEASLKTIREVILKAIYLHGLSDKDIRWRVEFSREEGFDGFNLPTIYSQEWFDYVYNEDIKILELYKVWNDTKR